MKSDETPFWPLLFYGVLLTLFWCALHFLFALADKQEMTLPPTAYHSADAKCHCCTYHPSNDTRWVMHMGCPTCFPRK